MEIQFNNLNKQWQAVSEKCLASISELFENSSFILGPAVGEFEKSFARYIGTDYCVGVSNGTDALKLATQSFDFKGSTLVIIPANTFVATIFGIEQALPNATFKLVDCDEYYQMDVRLLRELVAQNRKKFDNCIIVPVHLYGYTCDMDAIIDIASDYNCRIIEDASQAHGAKFKGKNVGSFGDIAAFSLYPGKNLGAAGDAGAITTNNPVLDSKIRMLRNLGSAKKYHHEISGGNHRLDTIQAIVLNEKLKYLDEWNHNRVLVANRYVNEVNNNKIRLPLVPMYCDPVHHIFPVLTEDRVELQKFLSQNGVQNMIHYPSIISDLPMYSNLGSSCTKAKKYSETITSIPMHPFLEKAEVDFIINVLNAF